MMGLSEQAAPLPDIKLEGYEYLFTEELHRLRDTEDTVDAQDAQDAQDVRERGGERDDTDAADDARADAREEFDVGLRVNESWEDEPATPRCEEEEEDRSVFFA